METISLLRVNEEGEIVGYYQTTDESALSSLGNICYFESDPNPKSHTCIFPARQCSKAGWENCCCIPLPGIEIRVSCHG